MKRVITSFFATAAALVALLSFKTHPAALATASTDVADDPTTTSSSSTIVSSSVSRTSTTTGSSSSAAATSTTTAVPKTTTNTRASTSGTKTATGAAADTRWGPVQVKVTQTNGKITAIDVIEYPTTNSRDRQINAYAVPELVSQALAAQSANVDGVSGATYTTDGFETSLQSAINKLRQS